MMTRKGSCSERVSRVADVVIWRGKPQCLGWRSVRHWFAGAAPAGAAGARRRAWIGQARRGWPGWTARPYVTGFTAITLTELPGSLTTDSSLPQPGHFWLISCYRGRSEAGHCQSPISNTTDYWPELGGVQLGRWYHMR